MVENFVTYLPHLLFSVAYTGIGIVVGGLMWVDPAIAPFWAIVSGIFWLPLAIAGGVMRILEKLKDS